MSENQRVVACIIERDARLLVCQRPSHKRHGGLWEFPGGKCEPGETDLDAARRELNEELGIEVQEVRSEEFAVHDPGSPFLIAFVRVIVTGEPVCREHTDLMWATPCELMQLPLAPSDCRYVEFVLERVATAASRVG